MVAQMLAKYLFSMFEIFLFSRLLWVTILYLNFRSSGTKLTLEFELKKSPAGHTFAVSDFLQSKHFTEYFKTS